MDETWSCVRKKSDQVRIWPAPERQTRRIAGAALGDRSAETCRDLSESLPADCRTDRPESHAAVLPPERHRASGKGSGGTSHIERLNCTLRQRCPNPVRKTPLPAVMMIFMKSASEVLLIITI
ncbi:MAG: IS1 family transposase [Desulfobacterales bacterium]